MTRICLLLGSTLLAVGSASLAQPSPDEAVKQGKVALTQGRYEEALQHFDAGAKASADRQSANRFRFYRALTLQRRAESEPRKQESRLRTAAKQYRKFLKVQPDSAAAHNNLGQVNRMLRRYDLEHLASAEPRETAASQLLSTARRRRDHAQAELETAIQELRYVEQRLESGAFSEADLEKASRKVQAWQRELAIAIAEADRADSELRAARARLSLYRTRLDRSTREAGDSYRRAIELEDERRPIFLRNYAEYLDELGEWQAATTAWKLLTVQLPGSRQPRRAMMNRYIESVPQTLPGEVPAEFRDQVRDRSVELAEYLWGLLDSNQPAAAVDAALQALEERQSWAEEIQGEFLTVVSVGLARRLYEPSKFGETTLAKRLSAIAESSPIGAGAAQILALHATDSSFDPTSYPWWQRGDLERDPPRGMWPTDGFRELIRSLGLYHQQQARPRQAEDFFRLAVDFQDQDADPAAVKNLVALFLDENRFDRVNELVSHSEPRLLLAEAADYRSSRVEKIFDYRRTLGGVYALVGAWGDETQVTSAVSQLDHARGAYNRLSKSSPEAASEIYRYTPEVTDLLARGYAATRRDEENYVLRLEAAERFKQRGDSGAVMQVLGPILHQPPPPEVSKGTRKYYRRVVTDRQIKQDLEALQRHGIDIEQPALDVHPNAREIERLDTTDGPDAEEQTRQLQELERRERTVVPAGREQTVDPENSSPEQREQERRERAAELVKRADSYLENGDLNSAARYYRQALELDPDNQRIKDRLRRIESRN